MKKSKNLSIVSLLVLAAIMVTAIGCGIKARQAGNKFKTVKIGNQEWMVENLNLSYFLNGDPIPEAKTLEEWEQAGNEGRPAWCYYNNDPKNGKKYGKLYNWYAVTDPRGLAPKGWRIPSSEDLLQLANYFGGHRGAGKMLKSTRGWAKDGNGTNESGFTGLPGGMRADNGNFDYIGQYGYWWSSTAQSNIYYANYRYLHWDSPVFFGYVYFFKQSGFSVRCLKD